MNGRGVRPFSGRSRADLFAFLFGSCLTLAVGTACTRGTATPQAACRYGSWTVPREVGPEGRALREPTVARAGSTAVLVASGLVGVAGSWPDDSAAPARLVVRGLGGSRRWPDLTGLEDRFALLEPRAVFDPDGTLHVVWAEPETLPLTNGERSSARPVTLWHAHLGSRTLWSEPEPVVGPYTYMGWTPKGSAELAIDRRGRPHVFATAWPQTDASLHLVETVRGWRAGAEFPAFVYVSVLLGLEEPLAAFVTGSERFGRNALFLARFRDGEWIPDDTAFAVSEGRRAIHFVKLLRAGEDVHLVWGRKAGVGGHSEINHASRRDGRWSEPTRVEPETPALFVGPVIDDCGDLHLPYSVWDTVKSLSDEPVLPVYRYRRWSESWSGELPAPPMQFAHMPTSGLGPTGEPIVVSTAIADSSEAGGARPATVVSLLPVLRDLPEREE